MYALYKFVLQWPEQFVHQNSVLPYPSTEDHKNQVYIFPKQYIIASIVLLHHNVYDCSIVSDPLVATLPFIYGH